MPVNVVITTDKGKGSTRRNSCVCDTFSTTNPIWTAPR